MLDKSKMKKSFFQVETNQAWTIWVLNPFHEHQLQPVELPPVQTPDKLHDQYHYQHLLKGIKNYISGVM